MKRITPPLKRNSRGENVANLQQALLLFLQRNIYRTFQAPEKPTAEDLARLQEQLGAEIQETVYGRATLTLVGLYQVQHDLGEQFRGEVEERTASNMNAVLKELGALEEAGSDPLYLVRGKVVNSNGVALAGYQAEAFVISLKEELSVGKALTGKSGEYSIEYTNPLETDPDIRVKAKKSSRQKYTGTSAVKYNATPIETLDIILDAAKELDEPEFNKIINDVHTHIGDTKLSELKEDENASEITHLANKTGWDGRITAMLASAHKIGENLNIEPGHVYALLRAGVPASEESIKSVSLEDAKQTISNAVKKNVIPKSDTTEETLRTLENLSVDFILKNKPASSVSTMDEMLGIRLNSNEKSTFAQTQKQVGGDSGKLWSELAQKGFSQDTIHKLQLDGKLGFLTGRNAPLIKKVYDNFDLKNEVDLVGSGLYKASEWMSIVGNDIPPNLSANEYAEHMADHVKMSYPTAVAAEMIKRNEVNLGANAPKDELTAFFSANESKNTIGVQQLKTWEGYKDLTDEAKSSAKLLERLYQITPSDEAMIALSNAEVHSAYQITRFSKGEFMAKYGQEFPNVTQAESTYIKATEVHSAALGIATTYLTTQSLPNVYSLSGRRSKEPSEMVANPTLEELLGNMDYCDCDHCKSVLSPAAYLVELLQFIDLTEIPHTKSNPIEVLKQRRPDIENIQLSCENTNMALPYIDLVNEVLEYYIVNGNLNDLKGHDIAEGSNQSELLAEPQFVIKAAYDELKTKVFPYNLPFHQPLETLRRLFRMWDVTLEQMLEIFSTPLLSRKESLDCNEDEYKTLTDSAFKKLPEYFGQPASNTTDQLNAVIANGKTFSRRMGITYEDLVSLLNTHFINPGLGLVPLFQKLGINLEELNQFYTGVLTEAELDALIPPEAAPEAYDGDIKQWLRDNEELIMGLITLTDIGPEATECNFAEVELRFALPDNSANALTANSYQKFHRFLRLVRKTGWSIETLDKIIRVLLPVPSNEINDGNIDSVFVQLFDRVANFKKIAGLLSYSEKKYADLLDVLDSGNDQDLRRQSLVKIMKMSSSEMSELMAFTGIDVFADDMEADEPSLMRFIRATQQLKAASLKVTDLAYILHHSDLSGKLTPTEESGLMNIKLLKDALSAVERENSASPENADFNFAKAKMLLVYDQVTTDTFFELLLNTKTFSAPFITTEEGLPDKLRSVDPNLDFDPFKKEIHFSGILPAPVRTALENAADSLVLADMDAISTQPKLNAFISGFKSALGQLFTDSSAELSAFGSNFPELKTIYDEVKTALSPESQLKKLLELILPELKVRLKINAMQQALISILKTDPDTVAVLTAGKDVIKSVSDGNKSVLYDINELERTPEFDKNQAFHFYIDAPATDDYLLYVSAPSGTVVTLKINAGEIIPATTIGADMEVKNAVPLALKAGTLHSAELVISSLPANNKASLSWRTRGLEKQPVPASAMIGSAQASMARTSLIRLSKAAYLQDLFKFTPRELEYFASENAGTKDFLNQLDTDGSILAPALHSLWATIELLTGFNLLKKENEPEENTWLQVLKNPGVKNSQDNFLLENFNGWQEADLSEVLAHYSLSRDDLKSLGNLIKIYRAMGSLSTIYYPAADVLTWITTDPSYDLVAGIKAAVKQKLTEASWLETIQSVNDPVRNLLRDALVNYILQFKKPSSEITDSNKLYEHFLIDVEMDACMKTSRIRLALSTVQLFIQRCLMNLEKDVDPASIREDRWAWMKRYRVWEANRKVFLYPENWLEPDLRDNKSFLFKELEGELLQSEITDESAELAFLNYLKKLDDIAKLEIVGTYLEENEKGNQEDDILHVIGRTIGNTRQYYYRRFEVGYWTPWEKISLNIEGEHIFPIVWRKRLFVFWLNIFEKPLQADRAKNAQTISNEPWGNHAKINVEVNMCWGEYYKGKWTSPKSTDLNRPMILKNLPSFHGDWMKLYGRKETVENPTGKFRERLVFNVAYWGSTGEQLKAIFTFTSKNAPPYLTYGIDSILANSVINPVYETFSKPYEGSSDTVEKNYTQIYYSGKNFRVNVKQPDGALQNIKTENVLTKKDMLGPGFFVTPLWHPVENQFEAPLTYADEHSTFFLKPSVRTFNSIRIFDGYFPAYETEIKYKDIPLLVDKPVKGWPPEDIFTTEGDLVIDNPWEWNKEGIKINENYKMMLPTTDAFAFGETVFNPGGKNLDLLNRTF
jgi:hypothetical protein